jgi:hypothetical protein
MNDDSQSRGARLLQRCFPKEKMEQLRTFPKFVLAVERIRTMADAMDAIELGHELLNSKAPVSRVKRAAVFADKGLNLRRA